MLPDYSAMYKKIFNGVTDAINLLQQLQRDTEDMFIESPESNIVELRKDQTENSPADE